MAFPVDILENCSHEELESLSEDYLSDLRCSDPDNPEYLSLGDNSEIPISLSTVGFVPLYGGDQTNKVLALFAPEDNLTAVALYLADQWWAVNDIVRTSNPLREGLQQARSLGERVVLYVLNRIIYRKQEMERNEVPFLCHSSADYAKILWRNGEAVGFYSVKPSGSMCAAYLTQSYRLPVLDTMFVRKRYRNKGFTLEMLEDFVDSFTEETLGLRYPLSHVMHTACKQYLEKYPGDQELLWEVEGVGHWFQRTLIASIFQKEARRLEETLKSEVTLSCTEASSQQSPPEPVAPDERSSEIQKQASEQDFTENAEVEPQTENNTLKVGASGDQGDVTPVSTRTRSSHLKRPKIGKKILEPEQEEADTEDNSPCQDPFKNLESKEQIVENFNELIQQLAEEKDESEMAKLQEEISAKPAEQMLQENQEIPKIPENCEDKQDVEMEPVNGDMTKDIFQSEVLETQETAREALDTESNLDPGDAEEKSLTTLVSVSMDLEKSFEDSFTDQVLNTEDLETSEHETMTPGTENTDTRVEDDFKEKIEAKNTEESISVQRGEFSDNGLSTYVEVNPTEVCATSDDTSTLDTGSPEEHVVNVSEDALPVLRQGPLLVVELEDVAFQQSDAQKSHSGDQSEESAVENDQSAQKLLEIGGESSSEDVETEAPVIERRGLRRKARGFKGPAKRRSKLSV
ncbi:soluble lamin-associated protein of 75 kDa isoform X2 [Spea bombifrons]|nr:soluble lamin-associated protein of 75 kDa isoform X2 [Spea bombifrons]XP_053303919.1 soluble lamin-associated protein of 75 kDa isoform X2 [Spea bombifrons]XP_053303920.1 soluble lamin-associated protein of 75 kDa isoform X2 [Spea bombifrons]